MSTLIKDHLAGGASRLAALLLPQILPVFSVVAPCHPGAALRDLVLVQRGRATKVKSAGAARYGASMAQAALRCLGGADHGQRPSAKSRDEVSLKVGVDVSYRHVAVSRDHSTATL